MDALCILNGECHPHRPHRHHHQKRILSHCSKMRSEAKRFLRASQFHCLGTPALIFAHAIPSARARTIFFAFHAKNKQRSKTSNLQRYVGSQPWTLAVL